MEMFFVAKWDSRSKRNISPWSQHNSFAEANHVATELLNARTKDEKDNNISAMIEIKAAR